MKEGIKVFCKTCEKDITPIIKMFSTRICPLCNKILSSDIGIDKANK